MRALTLRQPWAYCVAHLGKRLENRTWAPRNFQGQHFAIHAGLSYDSAAAAALIADGYEIPAKADIDLGAVVAATTYLGVLEHHPAGDQAQWWQGPKAWLLGAVTVLPVPVRCSGARGLWHLPDDVAAEVEQQCLGVGTVRKWRP